MKFVKGDVGSASMGLSGSYVFSPGGGFLSVEVLGDTSVPGWGLRMGAVVFEWDADVY